MGDDGRSSSRAPRLLSPPPSAGAGPVRADRADVTAKSGGPLGPAMSPVPRLQAIFFDLGGTLVDFRDPEGWAATAAEVGLTLDPEALSHAQVEVDRATDGPDPIAPLDYWRQVLERTHGGPVPETAVGGFFARWRAAHYTGRMFSDVTRCLEECRAEGRLLGIISNSQSEERVRACLQAAGIEGFFSTVVSSGTEGVAKPDRAIFDRAARRLGVANTAAFHVGDLAHTDARAAAAAGFSSVWLNRMGTGFGDDPPEITSLTELPGFVREIEGRSR